MRKNGTSTIVTKVEAATGLGGWLKDKGKANTVFLNEVVNVSNRMQALSFSVEAGSPDGFRVIIRDLELKETFIKGIKSTKPSSLSAGS